MALAKGARAVFWAPVQDLPAGRDLQGTPAELHVGALPLALKPPQ